MDFKFIPDEPLILTDDNDSLGTTPYVETLYDFVSNIEKSCTIGLFGPWGSGKSTIIESVYQKLETENKKKE